MIAAVTPAHADALAAIHATAFPPGERWDAAAFESLLRTPGTMGWIDDAGGLILLRDSGAGEAEILTFGVIPDARRRGVARGLLGAARAGRASALFLEVSASNHAALALYRGAGFERVGQRRAYYPDGTDAWIMRAPCAPPT